MKIFDEHFDTQLAYAVKQLIEAVSQETEVNFSKIPICIKCC